ncbi:hypothetical protein BG003_007774 [Podila horticola]|nr:hypothetical protein BG003_007774 [Podila horticola]
MVFAHLMERIFQTVLEQQKYYYLCNWGTNHGEIFQFEPVHGINDGFSAAESRVADLKEQLEKWTKIVKGLECLHDRVLSIHGPLLERIETMFKHANSKLYI